MPSFNKNYKYRWFLINGNDKRQINPTGTISITWELVDDTYYYEKKIGSFTIGGKQDQGKEDFDWVKEIESAGDICKELYVEVERKCDGSWELYARNQWTIQSCRFFNSRCNVTISPKPNGTGSCLQNISSREYNIYQLMIEATGFKHDALTEIADVNTADTFDYNSGKMFFYGGAAFAQQLIRPKFVNSAGNPATSGEPTLAPTPEELFNAGLIPEEEVPLIAIHRVGVYQEGVLSPPWVIYVAWAYRRSEFKIAGENPPTPNGYTILNDTVDPVIYQKKPTDNDQSVTVFSEFDNCDDLGVIPSASDIVYNGVLGTEPGIDNSGLCLFVYHKDRFELGTITLGSLLQRFIDQCDPDKIPISDFFQINPENPSTINYVTDTDTLTNNIQFTQRSDAIFRGFGSEATTAIMTWDDLIGFLRSAFWCFWTEDFDGNIRIEHYSYFESVNIGLDLTVGEYAEYTKDETNYIYKQELLPFIEKVFDDGNHHDYNWDDREIRYVDPNGNKLTCVGDSTVDRDYGIFNTNLEFFIEYPTEIPRAGWVVLACTSFFSETWVIFEDGHLNGSMSVKRLIERYYNQGRSAIQAKIKDSIGEFDILFDTTVRLKEEDELGVKLCCPDIFDPRQNTKTPLGIGRVISAEHNLKTNKLTLKSEY